MRAIKILKLLYVIQALVGIILTLWGSFFLAVMSTDSPSSSTATGVISGGITFVILLSLGVLLPIAAIRELERWPRERKLLWNWLDVGPMILFFFPFALWQIYTLWKLRQLPETDFADVDRPEEKKGEVPKEDLDNSAYIERRLRELSTEIHEADRK